MTADLREVLEQETVLLRVWFARPCGPSVSGDVTILRRVGGGYVDAYDADLVPAAYDMAALAGRSRNSDIPAVWSALIEARLLAPVCAGRVAPFAGHVYGQAKLARVADLRTHISEWELSDVRIISPRAYQAIALPHDDRLWPESYSA